MALPVNIAGISATVAPVGPFKLAAGNYTGLGITTGAIVASLQALRGTGTNTALGQTFTNGASAMTIGSITLNGSKNQSPTDNIYIEITATNVSGAVLGTSDLFPCASLPFTAGNITITFSTPVTISASATFGVVIRRQTADTTNYPTITAGSSSTYAGGSYFINDGSTWTDQSIDLYCIVNKQVTIASDAFYFFGRDGTTATMLQAYKTTDPSLSPLTTCISSVSNFNVGSSTASSRVAQVFTAANTAYLSSVTVALSKFSSPVDNVVCDIFACDGSGVPTGSSILSASNTIPASSISTGAAGSDVTFNFTAGVVALVAGTKYAIVLSRSGAITNSNYVVWCGQNTNTYADGLPYVDSSGIGTWGSALGTCRLVVVDSKSWSSIATKTGFTTAILNLASYQVGTVVHILVQDGTASTSLATKYVSFDMTSDTFLATTETVSAAVAVTGQVAGVGASASLVVRSNGEVVAFYNGVQTKVSGTFRARVYYRRRTGVNTYGTETQVDANAAIDNTNPIAVLGAADRVHFIWSTQTGVGYRTLAAGNALNTAGSSGTITAPGDGVSYNRSGTTKVVATTNSSGQSTMRFDSSDNPTPSFANQSIAAASIPHRIGADGTDVTIVYRSTADSDLYAIKSTDDGATFGAPVSFFVGTVASNDANVSRNSSGGVYQRGSNVVVGYIVNDNGTLKYNEYVIRTLGPPDQTLTPAKYTDSDTFLLPPVVSAGTVTLTPNLFTDADTFLLPPVVTAPGPTQTLTPALFTDLDTFLLPPIVTVPQMVTPALFTDPDSFGAAALTTSKTLTPGLFTDPDTLYAPTLTKSNSILPTTYSNSQNFFSPAITTSNTLTVTLFTDSDSFSAPIVVAGAVALTTTLYSDPDNFFGADIVVSGGIQNLTPAFYSDPDSFFGGALTTSYALTPSVYDDPDQFFGPTIGVGAVTVAPTRFDNSQTFFAPVVSGGGDIVLSSPRYDDPDNFFTHSITVGASALSPLRYDDADNFFAPSITVGAVTVVTAFLNDPDSFPTATVGAGAVTLLPTKFIDPDNFFASNVVAGAAALLPPLFSDPDGFFVHSIVPGSAIILPPLYDDPDVFFGGSVAGGIPVGEGAAFVSPPFIANVGSMMIRS